MERRKNPPRDFSLPLSVQNGLLRRLNSVLDAELAKGLAPELDFKYRYLQGEILSKYLDPANSQSEEDRRKAAIAKWLKSEKRNARTNIRMYTEMHTDFGWGVTSERVVSKARKTILRVLGAEPTLDVLYGMFSSGASTEFKRDPGVIPAKFEAGADITESCLKRFRLIAETCEAWFTLRDGFANLNVVEGGVLFTVPKNSEIDRVAVKEPTLNMFCQKGIGNFVRSRLRRILGIDLNDQGVNQDLAREGSLTGLLATLDLSSASDLISDGVVRLLLPAEWVYLLDDVRSRTVMIPTGVKHRGKELLHAHTLNMFSSMGNGFTFEVESLIFVAIAKAVVSCLGLRGRVSVYGDDIIVPSSAAGLLAKVLAWFGFKVNSKKSYWSGPFRESCGKHWYRGHDVTPFYVRQPIGDVERLILFLNRMRNWAKHPTAEILLDAFDSVWLWGSKKVPTSLYGGRDLARSDALVTPHKPRLRLVKETRNLDQGESHGAYLQWLRVASERGPVGLSYAESRLWDRIRDSRRPLRGQIYRTTSGLPVGNGYRDGWGRPFGGLPYFNPVAGPVLDPIVTSSVTVEKGAGFYLRRSNSFGAFEHPVFLREWEDWGFDA